jgi:hypothetical protein
LIEEIAILLCDFELSTVYGAGVGGGFISESSGVEFGTILVSHATFTIVADCGAGIASGLLGLIGTGELEDNCANLIDEITVLHSTLTLVTDSGAGIGGDQAYYYSGVPIDRINFLCSDLTRLI